MMRGREEEEGVELAELSLHDDGHDGQRRDGEGEGEGGDQAPLLADDGDVRAERRARRARKREAESTALRRRLRLLWKTMCGLLCVGTAISTAVTLVVAVELRRHLGRSFFALPLSAHLLLDALVALIPLLVARGDGEGEPPPPVPTSQVEFQRQLRAGRTIAQARRRPEDEDDDLCCRDGGGGCGCLYRLGLSRGSSSALALVYALFDAAWCTFFAVALLAAAWATTVEADGTTAPEWTGMHAALTAAAVLSGVAAGVRVLASLAIAAYIRARSRLVYVLRGTNEPPWHYAMSPLMQRMAIRQAGLFVAGSCALVVVGLGSYVAHWTVNTGSAGHYDHCDPLDTTLCALPFPSSFFLEEAPPPTGSTAARAAAASGTGYRVSFGAQSLPYTRGRANVAPDALNALDGFSTLAPILFYVEGMSSSGFASPGDIGASLHANSTTWLIEAKTGRMVPHFVELDAMDPESTLAVLQPAAPLRHGTRYIVAVCGALGDWGELLPPTPGFQELVDASLADRMTKIPPDLRRRASRFSSEIFPALRSVGLGAAAASDPLAESSSSREPSDGDLGDAAAGDGPAAPTSPSPSSGGQSGGGEHGGGARRRQQAQRVGGAGGRVGAAAVAGEGWGDGEGLVGAGLGDVQLAWDFVTASEESQLGVLRAMRESSRAWLDDSLSAEAPRPSPTPVVTPPRQLRLGDPAAAVEDGGGTDWVRGVGDRGSGRGSGVHAKSGGGGGSSSSEENLSGTDGKSKSSGGEGGSPQQRQRRRKLPGKAMPLYRVVKVEESGDYSSGTSDESDSRGNGDAGFTHEHPAIVRTVWGRMRAPSFVPPSARGAGLAPGSLSDTDTVSAAPDTMSTLEVGFVVRVPRCVAFGGQRPSAVVQYGHGLFGDRAEVEDGFLDIMAERAGWVLVAADWRGMSRLDLVVVARALVATPELLLSGTPEDLMQGFVNQEAVLSLVSRRLEDFLGGRAIELSAEDMQAVPLAFYGISQGAILGAGYTEFSSLIRRSVLGSGGTPFSLLMPRSVDFGAYHELLKMNFPGAKDTRLMLSLLQMSWDRLEAAAWLAAAENENNGDSEGALEKKAVLMQAGTGDAEVSVIGTEILARAYRASAVSPVAVPAWGIPPAAVSSSSSCKEGGTSSGGSSPTSSSASLALYNYRREAAEVPEDDTPPPWGWVHMCVRHDPDAQQQVLSFVETGCVVNFCNGPCERPYCRST